MTVRALIIGVCLAICPSTAIAEEKDFDSVELQTQEFLALYSQLQKIKHERIFREAGFGHGIGKK